MDNPPLEKAELHELDDNFSDPKPDGKKVKVQFNPESLKVSFANQIQTPSGAGDQTGGSTIQYVGAGTTKLSVQLWFDVNAPQTEEPREGDVRKLTEKIAYFITPVMVDKKTGIPPPTRFVWGSFQFDGIVESMEESLEFFSSAGIPLRASVTLGLTQQKIMEFRFPKTAAPPGAAGPGGAAPGSRPLTPAPAGSSLQNMAAARGKGDDWKGIAAANGIENPRILQPGQLIDLNATVSLPGVNLGFP